MADKLPEGLPPAMPTEIMKGFAQEVNEHGHSPCPEVEDRPEILKDEVFYVDIELKKKEGDDKEWWSVPGRATTDFGADGGTFTLAFFPSKRMDHFELPAEYKVDSDTTVRTWGLPGGTEGNRKICDGMTHGVEEELLTCHASLLKTNDGYKKAVVDKVDLLEGGHGNCMQDAVPKTMEDQEAGCCGEGDQRGGDLLPCQLPRPCQERGGDGGRQLWKCADQHQVYDDDPGYGGER
jgi:hypothetical protein